MRQPLSAIKTLRTLHGMTQARLASAIGVRQQNITAWESGHRTPGLRRAIQLSKVLGVTVEELVFGPTCATLSRFACDAKQKKGA